LTSQLIDFALKEHPFTNMPAVKKWVVLFLLLSVDVASAASLDVQQGEVLTLKPGTTTEADTITVHGTLRCDTSSIGAAAIVLRTSSVVIMDGGTFECGTETDPMMSDIEVQITDGASADDERGIQVLSSGTLRLHGDVAAARVARLAVVVARGDTVLQLRAPGVGGGVWRVGDPIVVAVTDFNRQPASGQNEERTITAVSADGLTVTLDQALKHSHFGGRPATFEGSSLSLDEAGYVGNLRRRIHISPAGGASGGGHNIVHHGAFAYVEGVEISGMGDEGKLGQYPWHWHRAANVEGQYIRYSSVHHTHQRCIVIHGTTHASVEGNFCFDFVGHGIFLEDHDETDNIISHNLVVLARKANPATALLASEHVDFDVNRFPSPAGIWVSHPANTITDNVVIASEGTGIWFSFVQCLCCVTHKCETIVVSRNKNLAYCRERLGVEAKVAFPARGATKPVARNVAGSNVVGMNWDGGPIGDLVGNPRNPADRKLEIIGYTPNPSPVFEDNTIYKSSNMALYFRGGESYFRRFVFADNPTGPLYGFNSVMEDCLVVAYSANAGWEYLSDNGWRNAVKPNGILIGVHVYDGPLVLDDVHFAGFPVENTNGLPVTESSLPAAFPVGIVGASDRYGSMAGNVTWEGTAPRGLWSWGSRDAVDAASESAVLYDTLGQLSGTGEFTAIVKDTPMLGDASCRRNVSAGNGAMTCGPAYRVGLLSQEERPLGVATRCMKAVRTIGSAKPDLDTDWTWDSRNKKDMVVVMPTRVDYRYHITELDWRHMDGNGAYRFQADEVGDLSPVFYLHWEENQCSGGLGVRVVNSGVGLKVVADDDAVATASSSAVWYDDANRVIAMRLQATNSARRNNGSPGIPAGITTSVKLRCADGSALQDSVQTCSIEPLRERSFISVLPPDSVTGEVVLKGYACIVNQSGPAYMEVKVANVAGKVLTLEPSVAADKYSGPIPGCTGTDNVFNVALTLPGGLSWSDYSLVHLRLGASKDRAAMQPFTRPHPVPTVAIPVPIFPAEIEAQLAQNVADMEAFRDALRADPLWGYCSVDTDCGGDTPGVAPTAAPTGLDELEPGSLSSSSAPSVSPTASTDGPSSNSSSSPPSVSPTLLIVNATFCALICGYRGSRPIRCRLQ
jgi:hypothetical protein